MIQPGQHDGYHQSGKRIPDEFFESRCPPIVTLDTIIIAVCGPNDHGNNASPSADGWYFSDFYLFHHLLRGTAKTQYWLASQGPGELVRKYKEYAHGNPATNDRRIVLDESMLADVEDVIVFEPEDLLERFLSYVTDASEDVKYTNRPILVLIFGHGSEGAFDIMIGGEGEFEKCDRLTEKKFKEAVIRHNSTPNLAVLTTACFGGGWIQSPFLNITIMAGVTQWGELLSWPVSQSVSRLCGSRYATGVAKALIKTTIEGFSWNSEEGGEIESSPTFAALEKNIHHILSKEIDVRENNEISFSAKDDIWNMEWRACTGFPLTTYQEKWKSLKLLSLGSNSSISQAASVRFSDSVTLSTSQAEYRLKKLAYEYLSAFPGPDEAPKNHRVHYFCRKLLRNEHLLDRELEILAGALKYRLKTIMDTATEYKDRLGISSPDCRKCDVYNYQRAEIRIGKEKYDRYGKIFRLVVTQGLFDSPGSGEDMPYVKGHYYMAMLFTESGRGLDHVQADLDSLARFRSKLILSSVQFHDRVKQQYILSVSAPAIWF